MAATVYDPRANERRVQNERLPDKRPVLTRSPQNGDQAFVAPHDRVPRVLGHAEKEGPHADRPASSSVDQAESHAGLREKNRVEERRGWHDVQASTVPAFKAGSKTIAPR